MAVLGGIDPSVGIVACTDTTTTAHNHKQLPKYAITGFYKLMQYLSPSSTTAGQLELPLDSMCIWSISL